MISVVFCKVSQPSRKNRKSYDGKFVTAKCSCINYGATLSNDDGDVNENGNNAIGLDWQNNNFARASRFFVHFFAVVARLEHESD